MTDNLFEFKAQAKPISNLELLDMKHAVNQANRPLAHRDDPQTSYDAAEKMVKSGALAKQEREVYGAIRTMLGSAMQSFDFTTKDIASQMAANELHTYFKFYDTCRRRFSGLHNKGKIERTGEKREGCMIWKLK